MRRRPWTGESRRVLNVHHVALNIHPTTLTVHSVALSVHRSGCVLWDASQTMDGIRIDAESP
eukprot:5498759-Pyramimonas_sp.AAC.1